MLYLLRYHNTRADRSASNDRLTDPLPCHKQGWYSLRLQKASFLYQTVQVSNSLTANTSGPQSLYWWDVMACLRAEVSDSCDRSEYVLLQKDTYRPSLHCIQVLWKEQQQAHGTTEIVHGRFPSSPCNMCLLPSELGQVQKCKFHAMLDGMHVNSVAAHWCKMYQQQPVRSELLLLVMGALKSAFLAVDKRALALWKGMKWTHCSSEVNRTWKKQERNGKIEKGKCGIETSL